MTASFPAQVLAVVFRRAAVYQPQPGELATFPGRVFRRAAQRWPVDLADAQPAITTAAPESAAPADHRLAGNQVLAAIGTRAFADELNGASRLARMLALNLTDDLDLARDRIGDIANAILTQRDLDLNLVRDLGIASDLHRELVLVVERHLEPTLDLARAHHLAHDLAPDFARALHLGRDLARDLTHVLGLGVADGAGIVRALDRVIYPANALVDALTRARDLVGDLASTEIDASGADLSHGDFSDLSLLEGVIWTRETVWPPGVTEQAELLSEEIAPGVYRVRGGTERDPSSLVTT